MSNVKWRSGIAATGFAAVIFVGTITGAQLKTDKQKKEKIEAFRATPAEEQITALEEQRKLLLQQRGVLQRDKDIFMEKARKRAEEKQLKREALEAKSSTESKP